MKHHPIKNKTVMRGAKDMLRHILYIEKNEQIIDLFIDHYNLTVDNFTVYYESILHFNPNRYKTQ